MEKVILLLTRDEDSALHGVAGGSREGERGMCEVEEEG